MSVAAPPEIGKTVKVRPDGLEELFDHDEDWIHASWSDSDRTLCGIGKRHLCNSPVNSFMYPVAPSHCGCGRPICPDCRLLWNELSL